MDEDKIKDIEVRPNMESGSEVEEELVEFEYDEDGQEDLKKTLKKLREDLKILKKEKEGYLTGWQKERADFINYKKEEENRKAIFLEFVQEEILVKFLSVIDSFDIAFSNKEVWEKVDLNWRIGIQHIYSQLNSIFEEYGIKSFGEENELFDPNFHQSVEVVETDNKDLDHKIAKVIQKGYKLGDRIIRPARVNIYEFKG